MAIDPQLTRYRGHLAAAAFQEARSVLDDLEQHHGQRPPWPEIIAAERERLERCGIVLAPGRSSRDGLPTRRQPNKDVLRERLHHQHNWYFNA